MLQTMATQLLVLFSEVVQAVDNTLTNESWVCIAAPAMLAAGVLQLVLVVMQVRAVYSLRNVHTFDSGATYPVLAQAGSDEE